MKENEKIKNENRQALGLALYLLNKEVKTLASESAKVFLYSLKSEILSLYGEGTNSVHEFERGGVGRLFTIGEFSFHNIYDSVEELYKYESFAANAVEFSSISQSNGNTTNLEFNNSILEGLQKAAQGIDLEKIEIDFKSQFLNLNKNKGFKAFMIRASRFD